MCCLVSGPIEVAMLRAAHFWTSVQKLVASRFFRPCQGFLSGPAMGWHQILHLMQFR